MKSQVTQALSAAIISLLRPLVKILLQNGISYGAFADIAKRVYVETAAKELNSRQKTVEFPCVHHHRVEP